MSFKLNILYNVSLGFIIFNNHSPLCPPGRCDTCLSFWEPMSVLAESPPSWQCNISGLLIFPVRRLRQLDQRHQSQIVVAMGQLSTLAPTQSLYPLDTVLTVCYANSFTEKDPAELFCFVCLFCNAHNSFLPAVLRDWKQWILPLEHPKQERNPLISVIPCGRQAHSLILGKPGIWKESHDCLQS